MDAMQILEDLHEEDPRAESIDLSNSNLETLSDELEYLHAHFPRLVHLNLSKNRLGGLPLDFADKLPHLTSLNIDANPIESVFSVTEALAGCKSLTNITLDISHDSQEDMIRRMVPSLKFLNEKCISPLKKTITFRELPENNVEDQKIEHKRDATEVRETSFKPTKCSGELVNVAPITEVSDDGDDKVDEHSIQRNCEGQTEKHATRNLDGLPTDITDIKGQYDFMSQLLEIVQAFRNSQLPQVDRVRYSNDATDETRSERVQRLLDVEQNIREMMEDGNMSSDCEADNEGKGRSGTDLAHKFTDAKQIPDHAWKKQWALLDRCYFCGIDAVNDFHPDLARAFGELWQLQMQIVNHFFQRMTVQNADNKSNSKLPISPRSTGASQELNKVSLRNRRRKDPRQEKEVWDVVKALERDMEMTRDKLRTEQRRQHLLVKENKTLRDTNEKLLKGLKLDPFSTEDQKKFEKELSMIETKYVDGVNSSNGRYVHAVSTGYSNELRISVAIPQHLVLDSGKYGRPPSPQREAIMAQQSKSPKTTKDLTLHQLVDLIECILQSKEKYDASAGRSGSPRETIEQHMYTYLNHRFGLRSMVVEYASAIWKGCALFEKLSHEVRMFQALLKNQVDEGYLNVKTKLEKAIRELLKAYLQAKYPLKNKTAIHEMVCGRVEGLIYEEEWLKLLSYLYTSRDSKALTKLVRREAESYESSIPETQRTSFMVIPFENFQHILLDYQLRGRMKLLESFRELFHEHDMDSVGIVRRDGFRTIVGHVSPDKSKENIEALVQRLDPLNQDAVTFSDAVAALLSDIRARSSKR